MKYLIENGNFKGNYKEVKIEKKILRRLRNGVVEIKETRTEMIVSPNGNTITCNSKTSVYKQSFF